MKKSYIQIPLPFPSIKNDIRNRLDKANQTEYQSFSFYDTVAAAENAYERNNFERCAEILKMIGF
jgi:hypothetical protein